MKVVPQGPLRLFTSAAVWKIVLVGVILVVLWIYLFTGTPPFGRRLALKNVPVTHIEFVGMTRTEVVTAVECLQVVRTLQKARDGGPVHACPPLGHLTIHFGDGTTNRFDLMPGHRLNRLDIVGNSELYSISMGEMFGTMEKVGLLTRRQ